MTTKRKQGGGTQAVPWPKVEGLKKFAGDTLYPLPWIKAVLATPEGSGALRKNVVNSLLFIKASNKLLKATSELPKEFATWREFREMNEARISEVKRKEVQKLFMQTSDGQRQAADAMAMTFSELDRRDRELPPALAGRNAVEISERMLADTKSIKKSLAEKFKEIGE